MKIQQLDLMAYGPFTDKSIDFRQGNFHVIYGQNEAGKSSALRALRSLLYGIDVRTTDNFIHSNSELRIGATLLNNNGDELEFIRRKGNKNTLLSSDNTALDDNVLLPFLGGITSKQFETQFGLDHQDLIEGGQEILKQQGEAGQMLFSAGLGSHSLHDVLKELDAEADRLYKSRGSTQMISANIKEYKEIRSQIKSTSLNGKEWEELNKSHELATQELNTINIELQETRKQKHRLERLQRLMPKLALHQDYLKNKEEIGSIELINDEDIETRKNAQDIINTSGELLQKARDRKEKAQNLSNQMILDKDLMEQSAKITLLYSRLETYINAKKDCPNQEREKENLLEQAENLLKMVNPQMNLEDISKLAPLLSDRESIIELGNQKQLLETNLKNLAERKEQLEDDISLIKEKLKTYSEIMKSQSLYAAIDEAKALGDIDSDILEINSEIENQNQIGSMNLLQLKFENTTLESFINYILPSSSTIRKYENSFQEHKNNRNNEKEKKDQAILKLKKLKLDIEHLEQSEKVPSEDELQSIREQRDEIWLLLKKKWVENKDISSELHKFNFKKEIHDEYEKQVVNSDKYSDRLRREASRVQELVSNKKQLQEIEIELDNFSQTYNELIQKDKNLIEDWKNEWKDIPVKVLMPIEMHEWLEQANELQLKIKEITQLMHEVNLKINKRKNAIEYLNDELRKVGKNASDSEELLRVLNEAQLVYDNIQDNNQNRQKTEGEFKKEDNSLEKINLKHEKATKELDNWEQEWSKEMKIYGFSQTALPAEISRKINDIIEIKNHLSHFTNLEQMISGYQEIISDVENEVAQISDILNDDFKHRTTENIISILYNKMGENNKNQATKDQLEQNIIAADKEIGEAESSLKYQKNLIKDICKKYGLNNVDELIKHEETSKEFEKIQTNLAQITTDIQELGEGMSLKQIEEESDSIDIDDLPGQIIRMEERIQAIEPKRLEVAQDQGKTEQELAQMDGNADASLLNEESSTILALIRRHAEQFLKVKLASKILRDQIEQYRKTNQGPIIKRAGEYFTKLTLNSYSELTVDFNENDEPTIVGIRDNKEKVEINGLSKGTRDQLYLALRLASIEKFIDSTESMPFIVDDILVEFDDQRTQSALDALSELSMKTEVILFTHHEHVVKLANNIEGNIIIHNI